MYCLVIADHLGYRPVRKRRTQGSLVHSEHRVRQQTERFQLVPPKTVPGALRESVDEERTLTLAKQHDRTEPAGPALTLARNTLDALVYNHDVFDKDYQGDRTEDQDARNPGVNASYVNLVHNDLNDSSGRVRCRELLTKNLRNFGREQHYTEAEADANG